MCVGSMFVCTIPPGRRGCRKEKHQKNNLPFDFFSLVSSLPYQSDRTPSSSIISQQSPPALFFVFFFFFLTMNPPGKSRKSNHSISTTMLLAVIRYQVVLRVHTEAALGFLEGGVLFSRWSVGGFQLPWAHQ